MLVGGPKKAGSEMNIKHEHVALDLSPESDDSSSLHTNLACSSSLPDASLGADGRALETRSMQSIKLVCDKGVPVAAGAMMERAAGAAGVSSHNMLWTTSCQQDQGCTPYRR